MPEEIKKRAVAEKLTVSHVLRAELVRGNENSANYIEVNGKPVYRVNIIGTIVDKQTGGNNTALVLDDGNDSITLRWFDEDTLVKDIDIGNTVQVIGRLRDYDNERYILIEIIKPVDVAWVQVRKKEIESVVVQAPTKIEEKPVAAQPVQEMVVDSVETPKEEQAQPVPPATEAIIKAIQELDQGDGVAIEDIPHTDADQLDKIVTMLLKEGDIFEVKPGRVKVLH